MNDLHNLVVDVGQSVIDASHPLVYSMRDPQVFRNGHPSLLMRKLV